MHIDVQLSHSVLGILQSLILIQGTEKISPNAWGLKRSKNAASATTDCPQLECKCDDDLGTQFYKQLVKYLFRKSQPIVDDFDGKHLVSVHLQISKQQLKTLMETDNVREIEAIVSAVIESSRGGLMMEAKEVILTWYDHLHYVYLRVINSQTLLLIILVCVFLVSILLMRLVFKINLIAVVALNLLLASLFFKYLDCNRRLEFENMERLKTLTEGPNPCDRSTSYMGLLSNYDSRKCTDYMM